MTYSPKSTGQHPSASGPAGGRSNADRVAAEPHEWIRPGITYKALRLTNHQRTVLDHWARERYPFEACGLLVGRVLSDAIEVASVHRARNLENERAHDRYTVSPEDWLDTERTARSEGLEVVGVWHTHPDHAPHPSRTDFEGAWEGYSYLITGVTEEGAQASHAWRVERGAFVEQRILEPKR